MTKLPTKNKSDNICCLNTGEYPGSNTNSPKQISIQLIYEVPKLHPFPYSQPPIDRTKIGSEDIYVIPNI